MSVQTYNNKCQFLKKDQAIIRNSSPVRTFPLPFMQSFARIGRGTKEELREELWMTNG
jgi:hypothetical protein